MRALEYRLDAARWLAARHLGGRWPLLAVGFSGVRLRDRPAPAAPAAGWVRLHVRQAGICGTDVAMLRGRTGPQLSPYVSFPAVPGHEVLAVVQEGELAGRRVVLDPFLGCAARGLPLCPACSAGHGALCHRFGQGELAPGMLTGYCRDVSGGWAESMVAHPGQMHPVPDGLDDDSAVLAEPLAVALHGVMAARPSAGDRVLVIGAGTIGLCVLAALRLLETPAEVVAVARYPWQADRARALGAPHVVPDVAAAEHLAADAGWGSAHAGLWGTRGWTGGFDQVFDAVGSSASMAAALRLARAGGQVQLLGCSGVLPRLDLTPVWAHELDVRGFCGYGSEPQAQGMHTIAYGMRLLAARPDVRLGELVTHRFPLERYREALAAAFFHRASHALKVVFTPASRS